MCGIAGLIAKKPARADPAAIRRMTRRRRPSRTGRRGHFPLRPHGARPSASLDHRPLRRRRPADDAAGTGLTITYNGEIYNYRELRDELAALGHVFRTQSDTEVILAAYAAWGEDCLDRFNGMWAFAILDEARGPRLLRPRPISA